VNEYLEIAFEACRGAWLLFSSFHLQRAVVGMSDYLKENHRLFRIVTQSNHTETRWQLSADLGQFFSLTKDNSLVYK
jgi:hypothetical protein